MILPMQAMTPAAQDGTHLIPGHLSGTVARRGDVLDAACPTRQLLDRVGDKWSVLVLLRLSAQDLRFNELKRRVSGVSQKMLSQTLRTLERDGLVTRTVESSVPISVTYAATPMGHDLMQALRSMIDWAERRICDVGAAQAEYDRRGSAPD